MKVCMFIPRVCTFLFPIHTDALRTVLVWGTEIFIFYIIGDPAKGEEWSPYSFVQLGGFALLIVGTLIYNSVLRVPGVCCGVRCYPFVSN
jgi:hypothetical protein